MRDIFEDIFQGQPIDPRESARRGLRPALRQRFYKAASVAEGPEGFAVLLDGRPVRTPARRVLAAPSQALAQVLADEWERQHATIDPAAMPLTRLANTINDGVVMAPGPVAEEVVKYLACDLVCYRAVDPDGLRARQAQHWDPILEFARKELNARFLLGEGIAFVRQPDTAVAAARAAIPKDPWRLGAVNVITSLTGSALIALAMLRGQVSADEAWSAARVDEDWNIEQWGGDEQELERRDWRFAELQAAAKVLALL